MRSFKSRSLIVAALVSAVVLTAVATAMAAKPLTGIKVAVDAGHGGWDPGAVGPTGLKESSVNLRVALALRNCLVEYGGATVLMTRWGDVDVTLGDRVYAANSWGAGIFVSVHHNASYNPSFNGTETYSYTYGSSASRALRDKVHARLLRAYRLPDRGARTASFYVIRRTYMPSILTEASYISNPYEEARLRDSNYTWREAKYIYNGIADYYGVTP